MEYSKLILFPWYVLYVGTNDICYWHGMGVDWWTLRTIHAAFEWYLRGTEKPGVTYMRSVPTCPTTVLYSLMFPWQCVWGSYSTKFCQWLHTEPGKLFLIPLLLCSLWYVQKWIHYGLGVMFICLRIMLFQYHHYPEASESIELNNCLWHLS